MQVFNIHEAKTNLSKLIEITSKGEEVVIAKAGKPVAKLSPYKEKLKPRKSGLWKGKVWVSPEVNGSGKLTYLPPPEAVVFTSYLDQISG